MAQSDNDDLLSIVDEDTEGGNIPNTLPLMPVRDVVIFSDMLIPLFIGREKSVKAMEAAVAQDGFILIAVQKDYTTERPNSEDIYSIGTVSRILRMLKLPDGRAKALVQGITKARIKRYTRKKTFFRVKIEILSDLTVNKKTLEVQALMRNVRENSEKILSFHGEFTGDISAILNNMDDPGKLADLSASNLRLKIDESQAVLEIIDPVKRLKKVNELLSKEVELSKMQAKIQSDVKDEISKSQRNYFLKEQVRAIHKELGEGDDKSKEIDRLRKKIKRVKMSKEGQEEALKELDRLERMHPDSGESSIIRTYLDWMVDLPWNKSSKDTLDIKGAKKTLDSDHYGLDKVKDRILEYLSVRKLNPKMKGPILCFIGPPGVGKTSIGRAIASAMKRKFVRISLGGIRDEAEIRGHRRTYIGAMPGRVLQGLKQCKKNNPVFVMDEIDKLCMDYRGDPSSALLEALDPEQNSDFSDHYINIPFDLSKVFFILTANLADTIPSALLDRMEIINFSGYTEEEKMAIAKEFLLPRQMKENGLKVKYLTISDGAMGQIIREYTCEAGLRNLERKLACICRKVARKIAEDGKANFSITKKNIQHYLGVPKYYQEMDSEGSHIGLSTGLAWTQAGGEVLYLEASLIGGKGDLIVTGQLGDVMQESARAAVSYARANLIKWGVDENIFEKSDIHIHVPAGAVPKDGPSAGIAMVTALVSAITKHPVNQSIAMTGEITLRGRVLPIGGLKEKAMGALRSGIVTIIMPEKNKRELSEVPINIKRKIKFIPVKEMSEVLSLAIENLKE